MNFNTKNAIFWVKKNTISLSLMATVAIGGFQAFSPKASQADFLVETSRLLTNISTAQENTILPNANLAELPKPNKKIKMVVTAYSSTSGETDSTPFITASNKTVKDGIVANNLLPFGTRIRIPELYGNKVFVVEDRMNQKKGNYHLDIWFSNHEEAEKFGAEVTYIEVLES